MSSITELRDTLIGLQPPPDDGSGRPVVERLDELRVLRNVLDHQIAVHIALLEDSGAPARAGSTTRSWLIEMGLPPTAAHRGARIAAGLGSLPKVADCAADGYLAAECVDAVVRGIASIDKQAATALSDDDRSVFESELLAQAFSGATPAEINTHARSIAMRVADDDPHAVAPEGGPAVPEEEEGGHAQGEDRRRRQGDEEEHETGREDRGRHGRGSFPRRVESPYQKQGDEPIKKGSWGISVERGFTSNRAGWESVFLGDETYGGNL